MLSLLNGDAIHPEILSEQLPFLIHGNNIQLILMQLDNIHKLEQEGGKIELVMLSPSILSILQEVIRQYAQGLLQKSEAESSLHSFHLKAETASNIFGISAGSWYSPSGITWRNIQI